MDKALWQSFGAQQAAFARLHSNRDKCEAGFVMSKPIATKLKPHPEGELVKEPLLLQRSCWKSNIGDYGRDIHDIEKNMEEHGKKLPVSLFAFDMREKSLPKLRICSCKLIRPKQLSLSIQSKV